MCDLLSVIVFNNFELLQMVDYRRKDSTKNAFKKESLNIERQAI